MHRSQGDRWIEPLARILRQGVVARPPPGPNQVRQADRQAELAVARAGEAGQARPRHPARVGRTWTAVSPAACRQRRRGCQASSEFRQGIVPTLPTSPPSREPLAREDSGSESPVPRSPTAVTTLLTCAMVYLQPLERIAGMRSKESQPGYGLSVRLTGANHDSTVRNGAESVTAGATCSAREWGIQELCEAD